MSHPNQLQFQSYFAEHVPLQLSDGETLAHTYTIEITRAMFTQECYDVFTEYQKKVHNDHCNSKDGYDGFLCQSPLYDPNHEDDLRLPEFQSSEMDEHRERKDEGVFAQKFGSYHMIHRIDG